MVPAQASVTLPEGLTTIEAQAFQNDISLTGTLVIPDGVTEIGAEAFKGCTGITGVVIPDSVTKIGTGAFSGCTQITEVRFPDNLSSIGEYAFQDTGIRTLDIPLNITHIPQGLFSGCSKLSKVVFPTTLVSIGDEAFADCCSLQYIEMPESVQAIGSKAFMNDAAMTGRYIFPRSFLLADDAYSNCEQLEIIIEMPSSYLSYSVINNTYIQISDYVGPDTKEVLAIPKYIDDKPVKVIGKHAFRYNHSKEIIIPDTVTQIDTWAFTSSYIETVTIPASVVVWGQGFFQNCSYLKTAYFPDNLKVIPFGQFIECRSLRYVDLPDNLEDLGEATFKNCRSLTSITLPNTLKKIGGQAFAGTSITNLVIPDSVSSIGFEAFRYSAIEDISLPQGLTVLEYGVFDGCLNLKSIVVPENVAEIRTMCFSYCENLTSVTLPEQLQYLSGFSMCTNLRNIELPEKLRTIGAGAFEGCSALEGIHIPESVVSIENDAFKNCDSLVSIRIPRNVESIGTGILSLCDAFTTISVDEANSYYYTKNHSLIDATGALLVYPHGRTDKEYIVPNGVTKISSGVFSYNKHLDYVQLPDTLTAIDSCSFHYSAIKSIAIPAGVTVLGSSSFTHCEELISVTLPDTMTCIKDYAFSGCKKLQSINIPASLEVIEYDAFARCDSLTMIFHILDSVTVYSRVFDYTPAYLARYALQDDGTVSLRTIDTAYYDIEPVAQPLVIPNQVQGYSVGKIGDQAFQYASFFTSIIIPDSVTSIGDSAFAYCSGLNSITIPATVTSIGNDAFHGCSSLTSVSIPDSVTRIWDRVFKDCSSLVSVTFPASITNIGSEAFSNCTQLSGTYLFEDSVLIHETAFANCSNVTAENKSKYRILAEETLLSFMNSAILCPDDLIGVMKANESQTWLSYLVNAAVNVAHLDFDNLNIWFRKEEYLFGNALSFSDSGASAKLTKVDSIPRELQELNKAVISSKDTFFNSLVILGKDTFGKDINKESFKSLFEQYRTGKINRKSYETGLTYCGIDPSYMDNIVGLSDWLGELSFINDVVSEISDAEKTANGIVDLWNQWQMVNALDETAMLEAARIYQQSEDDLIISVGKKLEKMARANAYERIGMLAVGDFIYAKIDKMVDKALEKMITGSISNSFLATVTITNTVIDAVTGVKEIPRLTNEVRYSADAVRSTYDVFQKDLKIYKESPTPDNFEHAYWDYLTYLEVSAQSQDAFVALYEQVANAATGEMFMTEEAKQLLKWAKDQSKGLNRFADDARAVYELRNNGDVVAFHERIDKIRAEEYTQPFSGGGGDGGGSGGGGGR